jgi:hypothetical protein
LSMLILYPATFLKLFMISNRIFGRCLYTGTCHLQIRIL